MRHCEDSAAQLASAIRHFFVNYQRFPAQAFHRSKVSVKRSGWIKTDEALIRILLGLDENENPQSIAFGEWNAAKKSRSGEIRWGGITEVTWVESPMAGGVGKIPVGPLVDPWGKCYRIKIDYNRDGWIPNPIRKPPESYGPSVYFRTEKQIEASILVVSAGPDGSFKTWEDNVVCTRGVPPSLKQWRARRDLARSLSIQVDQVENAINAYKGTISAQEAQAVPLDEFAATYLEFSQLYQDADAHDKAIRILKEGLEVFPENRELSERLKELRLIDESD